MLRVTRDPNHMLAGQHVSAGSLSKGLADALLVREISQIWAEDFN